MTATLARERTMPGPSIDRDGVETRSPHRQPSSRPPISRRWGRWALLGAVLLLGALAVLVATADGADAPAGDGVATVEVGPTDDVVKPSKPAKPGISAGGDPAAVTRTTISDTRDLACTRVPWLSLLCPHTKAP